MSDDVEDAIEYLREWKKGLASRSGFIVLREAADALGRLIAKNAELEAENAALRGGKIESEYDDWPQPDLYSVALLCLRRGHERSSAVCHAGAIEIERLTAENAALRAKVERLTPREPMTLEEIAALFNARRFKRCDDWEAGSTHVFSREAGCELPPIAARVFAQGLERDAKGGAE